MSRGQHRMRIPPAGSRVPPPKQNICKESTLDEVLQSTPPRQMTGRRRRRNDPRQGVPGPSPANIKPRGGGPGFL